MTLSDLEQLKFCDPHYYHLTELFIRNDSGAFYDITSIDYIQKRDGNNAEISLNLRPQVDQWHFYAKSVILK